MMIINDQNYQAVLTAPPGREFGCVPRDYHAMPFGSLPFAAEWDMPIIPEAEWDDRIADQERHKSSLEHIRQDCGIRSLDQDGYGYCWAFSTVKAVMLLRAAQGQPTVELSAWAVASIIKNYRNQGGWCQQSLEFLVKTGVPSLEIWPQGKVDRQYDTAEMRADAGTRKVTEWMDMEPRNKQQLASNLLRNIPTMIDLNWWGHSVCAFRLISRDPFRVKIDNSWTPGWGDDGCAVLEGRRAIPDGQACPRVTMAS